MAKLLKYRQARRMSNYSVIQIVFNTDAGRVLGDDEWMTPNVFKDVKAALPKGVDIDDEEFAEWNYKPDLHVIFHGADKNQMSKENENGLAFVAVYIDLITNHGLIYLIETEGIY